MDLITPTELGRRCEISKQAVFKAIAEGLIPVILQGKKKLVDLSDPDVRAYLTDNNRQREASKKNDTQPSELPAEKVSKPAKPSKPRDEDLRNTSLPLELIDLPAHEINRRSKLAEMHKKELQVEILKKNYLNKDFIQDALFRYLERLNSNIERSAVVFINDIGKKIIDAGEVSPAHIEIFLASVLELIDGTKKNIVKEIRKYEPRL